MAKKLATVVVVIEAMICLISCIAGILGCFDLRKINYVMPFMIGGLIISNGFIIDERNERLKQISFVSGIISILAGMFIVFFG